MAMEVPNISNDGLDSVPSKNKRKCANNIDGSQSETPKEKVQKKCSDHCFPEAKSETELHCVTNQSEGFVMKDKNLPLDAADDGGDESSYEEIEPDPVSCDSAYASAESSPSDSPSREAQFAENNLQLLRD